MNYSDLIERLRKRAEIRRQIPGRKSVQENKPDRIAELLDEAASALEDSNELLERSAEISVWMRSMGIHNKIKEMTVDADTREQLDIPTIFDELEETILKIRRKRNNALYILSSW